MKAKRVVQLFQEMESSWGSFDDFPALMAGADPMPHLSRNTVSQPFFLANDQDELLINVSGEGEIWFEGERPERMQLVAGDSVYLPAGVPSRIITRTPSQQVRFKAETPGNEAVAWYCAECRGVVHWQAIDPNKAAPQDQYWSAVEAFNRDTEARTCPSCGSLHPQAELGDIAWPAVAKAIRAAGD